MMKVLRPAGKSKTIFSQSDYIKLGDIFDYSKAKPSQVGRYIVHTVISVTLTEYCNS